MLLLLAFLTVFVQAEPLVEDYAQPSSTEFESVERFPEDLRWLYEIIMPVADQQENPSRAEKSFSVHTKDSYKTFPHPDMIKNQNLSTITRIEGKITYAGFFPRKYIHDILMLKDGRRVFSIKIHLKNATEVDWWNFNNRIKQAEDLWNLRRIPTDFSYSFKFEFVRNKAEAHYSVNVLDSTRGPYDTNWGRDWSSIAFAHELGHMLGLGDEYQTISGKMDCLMHSLMCNSSYGELMPHNYYFLLRRLLKKQ